MVRKILKVILWIFLALVALVAVLAVTNWDGIRRVMMGGVKVYETTPPVLPEQIKRPAVLVFSKTNGFRHEEAIPAANALFAQVAKDKDWGYFQTENGATFSPAILSRFDVVVFNNVSGDVFNSEQRAAFKAFLENGGGYVGIHAAGDNSHAAWDWYMKDIIGANFTAHTMFPQFPKATVRVEDAAHPATRGLPSSWQQTEEWYSFDKSPRTTGAHVLINVDEKSYNPKGIFGKDLRMGDHPMVWSRCVGKGRVLYSAFGHTAEAYSQPENRSLLVNGLEWAARQTGDECGGGATSVQGSPTKEGK